MLSDGFKSDYRLLMKIKEWWIMIGRIFQIDYSRIPLIRHSMVWKRLMVQHHYGK